MNETFEKLPFARILERFAARTPTPGGGAAAGLNAALGASLAAMALRFSVPRKVEQHELLEEAAAFEMAGTRFARAADQDCAAYERVRDSYRLPKESDEEQRVRREAIHQATLGALASPLELMKEIGLNLEKLAARKGEVKEMLRSDLVSAGWAFRAGCEMAWQNVKINAEGLDDDPQAVAGLAEGRQVLDRVAALCEDLAG